MVLVDDKRTAPRPFPRRNLVAGRITLVATCRETLARVTAILDRRESLFLHAHFPGELCDLVRAFFHLLRHIRLAFRLEQRREYGVGVTGDSTWLGQVKVEAQLRVLF
eukprot:146488-Prymnesium_polylepis.1